MREIEGWNLVEEAGERKSLPKGIYILKITNVVDNPEREYLEIYSDITDGEFKGYFTGLNANIGRDASKEIRSYKSKALPFFKAFITAVEHSNTNYKWDWNEKGLIVMIEKIKRFFIRKRPPNSLLPVDSEIGIRSGLGGIREEHIIVRS